MAETNEQGGMTRARPAGNYLSVTYGKIRQRSSEESLTAEKRVRDDGSVVWEEVFENVEGFIKDIRYREHKEYGNSFLIDLLIAGELYSLQLNEGSSNCGSVLRRLPNIDVNKLVHLTPYDFVPEGDDRRRIGITVRQGGKDGKKIQDFFTEKVGENEWKNKYGYPPFDPKYREDKDEMKVYMIRVSKFLREKILGWWEKNKPVETVGQPEQNSIPAKSETEKKAEPKVEPVPWEEEAEAAAAVYEH